MSGEKRKEGGRKGEKGREGEGGKEAGREEGLEGGGRVQARERCGEEEHSSKQQHL